MKPSQAAANTPPNTLDNALIFLLACGAGLGVAALYYNQPILGLLALEFGATSSSIGHVPTLTQVGYAIGILLLSPLGDRLNRRKVILWKIVLLCGALLAMAFTRSLLQLEALSLVIGAAASLAQDCVPAAAALTPEARRGKTVGTVMTGLLLGILLSRVFSGLAADLIGWRAMFMTAAIALGALGIFAARRLPDFAPTTSLPYGALLGSLFTLCKRHPELRRAAYAQGLLAAAFSAFWSVLAVMLHEPQFGFGSIVAGSFGLAGAIGALAAPVAGSIADRRGPELVTRLGAALVVVSFAAFAVFPHSLFLLVAGTLLFDLGVQSALIAHQSIIYGLEPAARSRLNALFIGVMFIGMAGGSALGSTAYAQAGWRGLCIMAALFALGALALRLVPGKSARAIAQPENCI